MRNIIFIKYKMIYLQLGLNCYLKTKYNNNNNKLIEIEKLYENINNYEKNDKIVIYNTTQMFWYKKSTPCQEYVE